MTIRHLTTFIKVAELGSITKAAEELCVAQPSVSQTIKELEEYYRITLFIRANKRLTLTNEGTLLLVKAKEAVESFKGFEDTARNEIETPIVKIGASVTFGIRALPLLLKELRKNIPNINYTVTIDKISELEDMLTRGELDFVLSEGIPDKHNTSLKSQVFGHDYMWVIAGKEYPIPDKIKLADLSHYDLLVREDNSNPRKLADYYLALKGIKYIPKMESISNNAIMKMVEANEGVAFVPMGVGEPYIEKGTIRKIETDIEIIRPLHVLSHKTKKLPPIAKKAMQLSFRFLQDYRSDD